MTLWRAGRLLIGLSGGITTIYGIAILKKHFSYCKSDRLNFGHQKP
jgi:hypothetical protein